jgi:hypothetical protein
MRNIQELDCYIHKVGHISRDQDIPILDSFSALIFSAQL